MSGLVSLVASSVFLRGPQSLAIIAVGIGVIVAVLAIRSLMLRDRSGLTRARRRVLHACSLQRAQRQLLADLAHVSGIGEPASLVISCGCFDHAASLFLAEYPKDAEVGQLRTCLFGNRAAVGE